MTTRKIIPNVWYCDNRPFSGTLKRFWGIWRKCPNCKTEYKTAKETTKARAKQLSAKPALCVECE